MGSITEVTPKPREWKVVHPGTGKLLGLVLNINAMSTPKVQVARRNSTNARMQQKAGTMTAEIADAIGLTLIVAAVDGWSWETTDDAGEKVECDYDGVKLEFSEQNLRKVLKDARLRWLYEELDEELNKVAGFFKDSGTTLPKP